MISKPFENLSLPLLGFGAMRLPVHGGAASKIDEDTVARMVDEAYAGGVRYFDTAYPYHDGESERVMGRLLKRYPRDSWYLADKYPGHQVLSDYVPGRIFEEQLKKCGVEYFDFYLLHNVCESSLGVYTDKALGIVDYFLEQKRLGRIKHLGFSAHGSAALMERFLDAYPGNMAFCQIQLNYLDWTFQNAKEKYELLMKRGIPVWVMEPIRGGKLAALDTQDAEKLRQARPNESPAVWALRWLLRLPGVVMILSGMSSLAHVQDNLTAFNGGTPLSEAEAELLEGIAERLSHQIPCTACGYCLNDCPSGLAIPELINLYNQMCYAQTVITGMRIDAMTDQERPSACIACGACTRACPQGIDIPSVMQDIMTQYNKTPRWADICKARESLARRGS